MIGKGVLLECLDSPAVEQVLVLGRRPLGMAHDKLQELQVANFTEVDKVADQLQGYDACFYCIGVSAMGMDEATYSATTFGATKSLADVLYQNSPDLVFCFVSGAGTDGTEKGRTMWARVKGKAENYVLGKGFGGAYMFRPGFVIPERGITSRTRSYRIGYTILRPLFPLLKGGSTATSTTYIGQAMLNALEQKPDISHLENKDINRLALGKG